MLNPNAPKVLVISRNTCVVGCSFPVEIKRPGNVTSSWPCSTLLERINCSMSDLRVENCSSSSCFTLLPAAPISRRRSIGMFPRSFRKLVI